MRDRMIPDPSTSIAKIPVSHLPPKSKVRLPVTINGKVRWVTRAHYEKIKRKLRANAHQAH